MITTSRLIFILMLPIVFAQTCSTACTSTKTNGVCNKECFVEECEFDGGDCGFYHNTQVFTIISSSTTSSTSTTEDNYGLVIGVGLGVFLTIIAMILGVLLCLVGTSTPYFFVFLVIGILLPIIVFLIMAFASTTSEEEEKTDTRTDDTVIPRIIVLILMIIGALFSCIKSIDVYFGVNLKARRADSKIGSAAIADLLTNLTEQQAQAENANQNENEDEEYKNMEPLRPLPERPQD